MSTEFSATSSQRTPVGHSGEFFEIYLRVADAVTNAVFDGPNDLVVDTASMTDLADEFGQLDKERQILDFQTTDEIHHCNYFQHKDTISFIRECFSGRR